MPARSIDLAHEPFPAFVLLDLLLEPDRFLDAAIDAGTATPGLQRAPHAIDVVRRGPASTSFMT